MRPSLIHPIPVYLRQIDRKLTAVQDDNLHEPVGQVRRPPAPVRLYAQVSWGRDKDQEQAEGGRAGSADGYLLFRTSDLRAARVVLDVGDRVTQIGDGTAAQETDLYLVGFKWMGHYQDQHGASLVRAYFEDRTPSRVRA
jgi:hypothetical protein